MIIVIVRGDGNTIRNLFGNVGWNSYYLFWLFDFYGKAPYIVNFFTFIPENDPRLLRIIGTIILIGIIVLFLPLLLEVENINLL